MLLGWSNALKRKNVVQSKVGRPLFFSVAHYHLFLDKDVVITVIKKVGAVSLQFGFQFSVFSSSPFRLVFRLKTARLLKMCKR